VDSAGPITVEPFAPSKSSWIYLPAIAYEDHYDEEINCIIMANEIPEVTVELFSGEDKSMTIISTSTRC